MGGKQRVGKEEKSERKAEFSKDEWTSNERQRQSRREVHWREREGRGGKEADVDLEEQLEDVEEKNNYRKRNE